MGVEQKSVPITALHYVEQFATPYLEKGRPFDLPHTKVVVYYAGLLATKESCDVLVHTTTAWLHDTGYHDLLEGQSGSNYDDIKDKKELHMTRGAYLVRRFFIDPLNRQYYSENQRNLITHLVYVHDKLEDLKTVDEILFMEADTLGAIDVNKVKPTFNEENAKKYILRDLNQRRFPRFQSRVGTELFRELYPKFLEYYNIPKKGEYKIF